MEKKLELKNYHLKFLFELLNIPLHGKRALARNRVAIPIQNKAVEAESKRMALIDKYGVKGEDGKPKIDPVSKNFELSDKDAFQKEYDTLMQEDVVIDVSEIQKPDLMTVKNMILDCKVDFDVSGTVAYSELCSAFMKL